MKVLKINSRAMNRPYAYILAPREKSMADLVQEFKLAYGLAEPPSPEQNYYERLAHAQLTHLKHRSHTIQHAHAVPQDLCQIFVEWLLQKENFRLAGEEHWEQLDGLISVEESWF
jgi:hypothetical protein